MNRILSALLFLTIGAAFIGALSITPALDCNELCPDWFTGYLIIYYILPIAWMLCGAFARNKPDRLRTGIALAVINTIALVGVIAGTRHFVML